MPTTNELSKRTVNNLEILLQEMAHAIRASGLRFMIVKIVHFLRVPVQLIEYGVRFVKVNLGGWDCHNSIYDSL